MRIGYACINTGLREKDIWTGRTLRKKTYNSKGLSYVSDLVKQNVKDLKRILEWNEENNIHFFRMSSNIFPFIDWYNFEDLPDYQKIKKHLEEAGQIAQRSNQRITQHPDHFVKIASDDSDLIEESLRTLESQSKIFDLMGLEGSVFNSINIHIGGAYGDKNKTMSRFCDSIDRMSPSLKNRLTVENDDKKALFTVQELCEGIFERMNIPVVFDSLHYACHPDNKKYRDTLLRALNTWPDDITPIVHHSNSKKLFEDEDTSLRSHTDGCYSKFYSFGHDVDIMIEAKDKEKARSTYVKSFL